MKRVNFWFVFGSSIITALLLGVLFFFFAGQFTLLLIGPFLIYLFFAYSRLWIKTDTVLYKVARQPLLFASTCTSDSPAQVYGNISTEKSPIFSPYSNTPCVFYHYISESYVSDGDSSSWVITSNYSGSIPFFVNDESGAVKVALKNIDSDFGKFSLKKSVEVGLASGMLDFDKNEVDAVKIAYKKKESFFGKVRHSEYVLPIDQSVFVSGWCVLDEGQKMITDNADEPLIVSRKTKEEYLEDFAKGDNFFFTSNFLILFAVVLCYYLSSIFLNPLLTLFFGFLGSISLFVILGIVCIYILFRILINVYNRMVELRVRCDNAKSQILIELKKRSDLIPLLEDLAKGHAKYEKSVLLAITLLRENAKALVESSSGRKLVENDSNLKKIVLSLENYPSLYSSSTFKDFMFRLTQVENNIAYYRGFYNKTVVKYNTLISLFPFLIIAKLFGFKEKESFEKISY